MNKPCVCPDCQNTGRVRIVTQVGEYTHEREEYCLCPIGRKLDPDGTGEFPPAPASATLRNGVEKKDRQP